MSRKTDKHIHDLEMRAYESIDKIERSGDERAKYEYLEIMTVVAFFVLDSLRAIRFTFCLMAGAFLYLLVKLLLVV